MQKIINNILAPVTAGKQGELVADNALRMANHFQCGLHLLLAEGTRLHSLLGSLGKPVGNSNRRLAALEEKYAPLLHQGLSLRVSACKGDIEQQVAEYAIRHFIDVIVVGKAGNSLPGSLFGSLSINRLARKTKAAVLTVDNWPALEKVQNIVLPVGEHLPIRKMMIASYFARKFNARIHLIGLSKKYPFTSVEDAMYVYKTFQLLRDNTNLEVEYHIIRGENIADKTLEYAQDIKADLIVVNPGKELLLSGFINKMFARFIFNESPIPVMTINHADG